MNLILFEENEVVETLPEAGDNDRGGCLSPSITYRVTIPPSDRRYVHCRSVLHVDDLSVVRLGVMGKDMYDASVVEISETRMVFEFSSSRIRSLRAHSDLNMSLILAVPRPKVLGRLWPVFSQLGFRRVMLVRAARVEESYFGSHFMHEANYRPLLMKGLEQASVSTRLPVISFEKREFSKFLESRLDVAFPQESCNRFICHPESSDSASLNACPPIDPRKETVIALGPEGGWQDFEIAGMIERGFRPVTCSSRVFTTDVALIALASAISCRLRPELMGESAW